MRNTHKFTKIALILFFIGASVGAVAAQKAATPEQQAKTFYEWYVRELNREGSDPADDKSTLPKYVTKRLIKEIDRMRNAQEYDADYYISAQDTDDSWRVSTSKAAINGNTATLKVMLKSAKPKNEGFSQSLTVKMIKEGGVWKIDRVR